MKKLAYLAGVTAIGLSAATILYAHKSWAADHGDATNLATMRGADITDVYAWMTSDKAKVNLVMDVTPGAQAGDHFATDILYVFHVQSFPGFLMAPTAPPVNVICKFASDTSVECWVGATGYVKGDPSTAVTSADGKIKVFAGKRNDPFVFNLDGLTKLHDFVLALPQQPAKNAEGCIQPGAAGPTLLGFLSHDSTGAGAAVDHFKGLNVNAIVLQVDTALLATTASPILGVWGSTNQVGQ